MAEPVADVVADHICQVGESVPWFRDFEGGVTTAKGKMEGLLIGKSLARGDLLTERTIVTWIADKEGSMRADKYAQRMEQGRTAMKERLQVGVIIAGEHPGLEAAKISLPAEERFFLAGYWTVVDLWEVVEEKGKGTRGGKGGKTTGEVNDGEQGSGTQFRYKLMIRLDKVVPGMGWDSYPLPSVQPPVPSVICLGCSKPSFDRFSPARSGCCEPECSSSCVSFPLDEPVVYRPEYLSWRPVMDNVATPPHEYLPPPVITEIPNKAAIEALMDKLRRPMWHGYLCECGKLNVTIEPWHKKCRGCPKEIKVTLPTITLDEVIDPEYLSINDFSTIGGITTGGAVTTLPRIPHNDFFILRWCLSGDSVVWLMVPKSHVVADPEGPRKRFQDLLKVTAGDQGVTYSRFPMRACKVKGQRTRWFGLNVGNPYKANMMSDETNVAFDAKLPPVLHAVKHRLNTIVTAVTDKDPQFNEMLSMLYFPNMEMGFHSDGEQDVDTSTAVASESLGCTATMEFRMLPKLYYGQSASGNVHVGDPVVAGCLKYDERKHWKEQFDAGRISAANYERELKRMMQPIRYSPNPPVVLKFPLPGTGSIMMQQGSQLNQHYQHCVTPKAKGVLRLVNTTRTLLTREASTEKKRKALEENKKRKRKPGKEDVAEVDDDVDGPDVDEPAAEPATTKKPARKKQRKDDGDGDAKGQRRRQ